MQTSPHALVTLPPTPDGSQRAVTHVTRTRERPELAAQSLDADALPTRAGPVASWASRPITRLRTKAQTFGAHSNRYIGGSCAAPACEVRGDRGRAQAPLPVGGLQAAADGRRRGSCTAPAEVPSYGCVTGPGSGGRSWGRMGKRGTTSAPTAGRLCPSPGMKSGATTSTPCASVTALSTTTIGAAGSPGSAAVVTTSWCSSTPAACRTTSGDIFPAAPAKGAALAQASTGRPASPAARRAEPAERTRPWRLQRPGRLETETASPRERGLSV